MGRLSYVNLGGGLNQGQSPSTLRIDEFSSLVNFYAFSATIRRRGGLRRVTNESLGEAITGIIVFRPSGSPGVVVVASATKIAKAELAAFTVFNPVTGFAIAAGSSSPWTMFQYKDTLYLARDVPGQLIRFDGTNYAAAGIASPATAPTIADGAAGDIPAAAFYGVVTFYNTLTGGESDPSPASVKLTHAGSKKIDWSNIPVSTNPQVNARRLYRTLPDQSGEYFFVYEIDDNSTTTFTGDNVLVQDLGRAASFSNGLPPPGIVAGDVWKERLFVTDGAYIYNSQLGLVECFDPVDQIPILPDDGHTIRAVRAYGDRLIIGKTNKIHYLVGSDPSNFAVLTLSDRHGCVAHHSMRTAEGSLIWLGADNFYRADGTSVRGIATIKLRGLLDSMTQAAMKNAVATVFPELGWYVCVIPGEAELIYNYRDDSWSQMQTGPGLSSLGDFFDADYKQQIYGADANGYLYRFHDTAYGLDDNQSSSQPIASTFTFRPFQLGSVAGSAPDDSPQQQEVVRDIVDRVYLNCADYPEEATLFVVAHDGTILKQRTVSLDFAERWKAYALSTRQMPRAQPALRLDYSGRSPITIEGIAVDGEPIGRYPTRPH